MWFSVYSLQTFFSFSSYMCVCVCVSECVRAYFNTKIFSCIKFTITWLMDFIHCHTFKRNTLF